MKILNGIKWTDDVEQAAIAEATRSMDILTLKFEVTHNGKPLKGECCIDVCQFLGKVVEVQCQDLEAKNMVVWFSCLSNYSYANGNPSKSGATVKRIARIFINEAAEADVQWLIYVKPSEGIIERDPNDTHMGAAIKFSNIAKQQFEHYKKKSALVGRLDARDSLAYLEAQVDALTRYVLFMHSSDNTVPQDLREILEAADAESVLDIKAQDKLVKEMQHKKLVRQEQQKYYA